MKDFFKGKEIDLIITSIFIIVLTIMVITTIPNTKTVNADGVPEGTIQSENVLVQGSIQNTITYANGKTYSFAYGNQVTPIITTVQMTDWVLGKSNELICILQELAFPFCVVTFIIATFITLFGCLTGNAGKGLMGMSASAIGYAAILYAPTLVNVVVNFVS